MRASVQAISWTSTHYHVNTDHLGPTSSNYWTSVTNERESQMKTHTVGHLRKNITKHLEPWTFRTSSQPVMRDKDDAAAAQES